MSIFIGLIDKDPIRLLTPILDNRSTCTHAIFVGDETEYVTYTRLLSILQKYSITADFFQIPVEPSISKIKASIETLTKVLAEQPKQAYLNASCGLRHRLIILYEVFYQYKWPIFVIEPFSDKLCWMNIPGKESLFVQDHINLEEYLSVFGARCERHTENIDVVTRQNLINIGEKWANSALILGPGLATLNYLATKCRKDQTLEIELSSVQKNYSELSVLISDLCKGGLASYSNGILSFETEQARRFANGQWLELLVEHKVEELAGNIPTIQDKAVNLQVYREVNSEEVRNEIDVATIVNNKLHLIECKTKSMKDDGDDTLYKLESIRDLLGGFQARAMLVSFRPLKHTDISRAEDLGLALIGPQELPELSDRIANWLNEAGGYDPS